MMDNRWTKEAANQLLGRTIVSVGYMRLDEAQDLGWYSRPVMFELDDGTWVCPQRDDEGNDGGAVALFSDSKSVVLPVLGLGYKGNEDILTVTEQGEK
jgi:hypothetical protein